MEEENLMDRTNDDFENTSPRNFLDDEESQQFLRIDQTNSSSSIIPRILTNLPHTPDSGPESSENSSNSSQKHIEHKRDGSEDRPISQLAPLSPPPIPTNTLTTALAAAPSTQVITDSFEYASLRTSPFRKLGGKIEYICTLQLLPYLTAKELIQLGKTSKFFSQVTKSNHLWIPLYQLDFIEDVQVLLHPPPPPVATTASSANTTSRLLLGWRAIQQRQQSQNIASAAVATATTTTTTTTNILIKQHYVRRYEDYQQRISRSKEDQMNLQLDMLRLDRIKTIEMMLDLIQVRLFAPLLLICLLLSMILYVQRVDGVLSIPIWACAIPFTVAFLYLLFCIAIIRLVYRKQYSTTSLFKGLWNYMRGPMVSLYQEILNESGSQLTAFVAIICLMVLQIAMIVVKLTNNIPKSFRDHYEWGIVFIPIWILFGIYCILPLTKFHIDPGVFWFCFNLIWIPFFIFFVCLTVKLDSKFSMRLALIFIPFYIIEGSVLIASFVILLSGIYRFRRGFLERVDEHIALFAICWISISPLLSFEALLSARDDHQIHNRDDHFPSATEVVSPILIILGWITIGLTFVSWKYRTAFQELRATTLHDSAGLRVIHSFV